MFNPLTMNERLRLAGVKTIRQGGAVYLERNGVRTLRPNVGNAEGVCLAVFNVVI